MLSILSTLSFVGRNRLEGSDCRETLADIIVPQAHDVNVYMRQPAVQLQVVTVDTLFFFNKNLFYKNVEAEIDPDFKNILRTYPT